MFFSSVISLPFRSIIIVLLVIFLFKTDETLNHSCILIFSNSSKIHINLPVKTELKLDFNGCDPP